MPKGKSAKGGQDEFTVGVIGCGYWGPNLLRNFNQLPGARVKYCCDLNDDRLKHMKSLYPHLTPTKDVNDLINDKDVDAVVVATPVSTHYPIAEAEDLVKLADEVKKVLFVGHTFVYSAAVEKMKTLLKSGELGDIYYVSSVRVNLGLFQEDINVIWDLAPHDISIMNYLFDSDPVTVTTFARSYIQPGIEDIAFLILQYPGGTVAHIQVSWLDPNKIRRTTLVGSKKMLVYDDTSMLEKIRVYDKGVDVMPHYDTFGEFQLSYRFGDIVVPKIKEVEPLKKECSHFMDCALNGTRSQSSGRAGLSVVKVVERACESAKLGGAPLPLDLGEGGER